MGSMMTRFVARVYWVYVGVSQRYIGVYVGVNRVLYGCNVVAVYMYS